MTARRLYVFLGGLVAVVALWAAVRDPSAGGGDTTGTVAGPSTGSSDPRTLDTASVGASTTAVPSATSTTVATPAASTSVAGGTSVPSTGGSAPSPTPVPSVSDPFASTPEPDPTEPDDLPGPPLDGCIDAPAGLAVAELGFDDDVVRFAEVVSPVCVRLHAAQRLGVRSAASSAATVLVGAEVLAVPAGSSAITAPMGDLFAVGDVFDVYFEALDANVVVQVLP